MKLVGVVAEYNPFHRGHEYMLAEIRRQLGEDTSIVCVMSGSFVQRGECALLSKFARAEAAVKGGADLVLELPLPWALSSAEHFARGAVSLLSATGLVSHLAFGSECGDVERLSRLAEGLQRPEMDELIREDLRQGVSYAAARQLAAQRLLGDDAALLASPNDILAVEYLKTLGKVSPQIIPLAIRRVGAGHDQGGEHEFLSASELRRRFCAGEDIAARLPRAMGEILLRECIEGKAPFTMAKLETALLSRLRMLPKAAFSALADNAEGLDNRLYTAVHEGASWEEILTLAKSKRYAMARLRRMLVCAGLGMSASDRDGTPPYLRALAMSRQGRAVWRQMEQSASLPRISRPGEVKALGTAAQRLFGLEAAATDFCALALEGTEHRRPGQEWRRMPYIHQTETGDTKI